MTIPIEDQIEALNERLKELREHTIIADDGEPGLAACTVDGYPTTLTCICGHGHNRHNGRLQVRCMSYTGQPDCGCSEFVPDAASTSALWTAHDALLRAVDFDAILALVPQPDVNGRVHEWPEDERELWYAPSGGPYRSFTGRRDALALLRRQKIALAIVTALVGAS